MWRTGILHSVRLVPDKVNVAFLIGGMPTIGATPNGDRRVGLVGSGSLRGERAADDAGCIKFYQGVRHVGGP
jgi:hypothetical protein